MSKSILVTDTPEKCNICPLFTISDNLNVYCVGFKRKREQIEGVYDPRGVQRPDWCPLKEMPLKKPWNKYHNNYERGRVDGYNACIDEILNGGMKNE